MHLIFDKITKIPRVDIDFFNKVFRNASDEILDTVQIIRIPEGRRFVAVDEEVDLIRILLSGKVQAMEEYLTGDIYIFSKFDAPEIFGEMEALGGINNFRASLETEEDSIIATLPIESYLQLVRDNTELLFERIRIIIKRSTNDQKENRLYLSLDATDRIKVYFIKQYRQYYQVNNNKNNKNNEKNKRDDKRKTYTFRATRQQIADETGYSVKTVNRTIKKLVQEGLISMVGQKFQISKEQYSDLTDSIYISF